MSNLSNELQLLIDSKQNAIGAAKAIPILGGASAIKLRQEIATLQEVKAIIDRVVFCRNCKYLGKLTAHDKKTYYYCSHRENMTVTLDFFCGDGKRKEGT